MNYKRNKLCTILICIIMVVACVIMVSCDDKSSEPTVDFAVTFVLNNGDDCVVWHEGDIVPTPTRDGYVFDGWYADIQCEEKLEIDFENIILVDSFTVYANWIAIRQFENLTFEDTTVVYDGNAHTISVGNLPLGASVQYANESFINAGTYQVDVTVSMYGYEDVCLSATLTIEKAQISGVAFENLRVLWDGESHSIFVENLPEDVTVTYQNNGQTDVGAYTIVATFDVGNNYLPLNQMSAILEIVPTVCHVTFVDGDGSQRVVDVDYNTKISGVNPPLEKVGYNAYWDFSFGQSIVEDLTITAVYVPIIYKISLEYIDYADVYVIYNIEKGVNLPIPTRNGYTFEGWYVDYNFLGEPICKIDIGSYGDMTLYPKWSAIVYNINYVLGIEDALNDMANPKTFCVEDGIITLNPATSATAKFEGWYLDAECKNKVEQFNAIEHNDDITLYASWTKFVYSVSYDANGGIYGGENPTTYSQGDDFELVAPTRANYIFLGWMDKDGRKVTNLAHCIGDMTLRAEWQAVTFYISYNTGGVENTVKNVSSYTIEDDEIALYPLERRYYDFLGWIDEKSGEYIFAIDTQRAEDISLRAVWTETKYNIYYHHDGGEFLSSPTQSYTYFESVELVEIRKVGFDFCGWFDNEDCVGDRVFGFDVGNYGDKHFYALFKKSKPNFEYIQHNEGGQSYIQITRYVGSESVVSVPNALDGVAIKSISVGAFENCDLQELHIDEGIETIEVGVFSCMQNLHTLTLPSTLKSLPNGLLKGCQSLRNLTIPYVGNVKYNVGDVNKTIFAFANLFGNTQSANCVKVPCLLAEVNYAGDVMITELESFCYVPSSLKSVTVLNGDVFSGAFAYCEMIENICILGSGSLIGTFAFRDCTALTTLEIRANIQDFDISMLYGCRNIANISVANSTQYAKIQEMKDSGKIGANVEITIDEIV